MAFTTNLTGVGQVDNSIMLAFDKGVMIANGEAQKLEGLVDVKAEINAKSIRFTKYSRLALATTPLTETDDVASVALSDSEILLTPVEYGNAVTTTALSSFQTGGMVDLAAAKLVGINMGMSQDQMIIDTLITSSNITAGAVAGYNVDASYSELAKRSVAPVGGDLYVLLANETDIATLRSESDFFDVQKYSNAQSVLRNEVGIYKGHRIVRHQGVPAGKTISVGANALGKAVSKAPGSVVTQGADKLGRFVHIGWYGVFKYGVIDADAIQLTQAP